MPHHEFFIILNNNIELFYASILVCAIPIFYIAKYFTHSWLDPLRMGLLFVPLANAVLLFLFVLNEIPSYLFYYTAGAEMLFWIGFLIPAKREISFSKYHISENWPTVNILFILILTLYIAFYLITYAKFGIPLFLESRLSTYVDSGGFGAFLRLNSFFEIFILIYCYMKIDKQGHLITKIIYYIPLLLVATTGILSGSRSSMLTFFACYFGYLYYFKGTMPNDKKLFKYFPLILIGTMSVFLIKSHGDIYSAILGLLVRLAATGDCYYMAYPNEIINFVDVGNSTLFLLSNILAPLRIIDSGTIPPSIGVQLANILFPQLDGLLVGPNSRPPILGFVLFSYLGLVFTFITGFLTSCIIFRLPSIFPRGFVPSVVLFFIYIVSIRFITDPTYGLTSLFDVALNLFFLIILVTISCIIKSSCARLSSS